MEIPALNSWGSFKFISRDSKSFLDPFSPLPPTDPSPPPPPLKVVQEGEGTKIRETWFGAIMGLSSYKARQRKSSGSLASPPDKEK